MNKTETIEGIKYTKPTVILLQDTGIGTSEYAARTCYDSFDTSENECIKYLNDGLNLGFGEQDKEHKIKSYKAAINGTEHSDLLDQLAWTHFHHSILEHAVVTYLFKGISRGVLQEEARHRIQSLSVRSTRYTGAGVLNAFVASLGYRDGLPFFTDRVRDLDMFVQSDSDYIAVAAESIYNKLHYQRRKIGQDALIKLMVAKSSLPLITTIGNAMDLFNALQAGKAKRNALDPFKHIVDDNWKVDMVVTMNIRSLKNFLELRDSGAAWFQIRWLAQAIKEVTPSKYLDLIVKQK